MLTLQAREARLLESRPCTRKQQVIHGIFTLSGSLFRGICTCRSVGLASVDYNSESEKSDFHHGLFPVHSPLLKESQLVSVPPLTYMLKFSGSSRLTSCLGVFAAWLQVLRRPHATHLATDSNGLVGCIQIQRLRTRLSLPHGCRFGHRGMDTMPVRTIRG